jgi:iron(III) transport system substrate-binding protein
MGLALVGCGDDDGGGQAEGAGGPTAQPGGAALQELVDAAKREGSLVWYTALTPTQSEGAAQAFERAYGIHVEVVRLVTGNLISRFAGEAEAGNWVADLVIVSDVVFAEEGLQRRWFTPISEAEVPAYAGWPQEFRRDGFPFGVGIVVNGLVYNKSLIKESEAPKDWPDLLEPRFKGAMFFADPRSATYLNFLYFLRENYGDDFLRRLGQQDLNVVASSVTGAQQVAAGERALMVPSQRAVHGPLIAQGAPLAEVQPDMTTGAEMAVGLVAKAPHPNAARLFLHWLLTREGQQELNKGEQAASPFQVPGALPLPPKYQVAKPKEAQAAKDTLLRLVGISA